jgi:hypothetical protein
MRVFVTGATGLAGPKARSGPQRRRRPSPSLRSRRSRQPAQRGSGFRRCDSYRFHSRLLEVRRQQRIDRHTIDRQLGPPLDRQLPHSPAPARTHRRRRHGGTRPPPPAFPAFPNRRPMAIVASSRSSSASPVKRAQPPVSAKDSTLGPRSTASMRLNPTAWCSRRAPPAPATMPSPTKACRSAPQPPHPHQNRNSPP